MLNLLRHLRNPLAENLLQATLKKTFLIENKNFKQSFLAYKFDMKDMGKASVISGLKIIRKGDSILLSQEHYVEKLLRKYKYYDCKLVSTPYDANS